MKCGIPTGATSRGARVQRKAEITRTHEMARKSERRRSALREKSREVTDIEIVMIAEEDVEMGLEKSAECALLKLDGAFLVAIATR